VNVEVIAAAVDEGLKQARRVGADTPTLTFPRPEFSAPVEEALKSQEEFSHGGFLLNLGGGYCGFQTGLVAQVLIQLAEELGSARSAADWLDRLLHVERADGLGILALWGLKIARGIRLTGDVELKLIKDIPDSRTKQWVMKPKDINEQILMPTPALYEPPELALVGRLTITPLLHNLRDGDPPRDEVQVKLRDRLDDILLCLTAVGPCTPIQAVYWFQFEDKEIERARVFGARMHHHSEITPHPGLEARELDADKAQAVVGGYFSLGDDSRRKVRNALDRLHRTMLRTNIGDQAVELSTSLESLVATGAGENTFKVALRSALLLDPDEQTRLDCRSLVKAVYNLRSKQLHSGRAPDSIRVGEKRRQSAEVVLDGARICAALICRVIELRGIPDWSRFDLGIR